MNKEPDHIDILISKELSSNSNQVEKKELLDWLEESHKNRNIFSTARKAWDNSNIIIPDNDIQSDKIKLEQAYLIYLSKRISKLSRSSNFYKIAALIALPVTLTIGWLLFHATAEEVGVDQFCEITSPKGHVSKCILPDNTEVWLNTGSTIKYNTGSFNRDNREITVSGEAYFEVTKAREYPFKVKTPFAEIVVLGTTFNVKSYPDNNKFEAVVSEGKINLRFGNSSGDAMVLEPRQRLVFNTDNKKMTIKPVEPDMFTSWRNGEILFKDATLNDLIKELERIYDIRFHLKEESLGDFRFRGMFSYNNNLIEALEKIKKTSGVDYYIKRKEVWLKKSN